MNPQTPPPGLVGALVAARRQIADDVRETTWTAPDGHPIRRIDWGVPDAPRGSLLFMAGRGDAYEKYLESLAHWHQRGWRVTALDWRWQGGSGRAGLDATTGHVDDFTRWTADLTAFWQQWRAETPGPHVLVGHSMGGHLCLRAVADRLVDPAALVLSAPMLGFHGLGLPSRVLHAYARLMTRIGDPRRPAWRGSEKPGAPLRLRMKLLTHDPDRYADELYWHQRRPELEMGAASWGWLAAALASIRQLEAPGVLEAIATPVLLFGSRADGLVRWRAIARAAKRLPHAELLTFGIEARHEILREVDPVRDRALTAIDNFLDRVLDHRAPPRQPAA